MKSKSAFCLFFLAGLLSVTECFPTGAPAGACTNVAPNPAAVGGHGAGPQNSAVPYVLTGLPSSGNYTPGMSYTREFPLTDYPTYYVSPSRASRRASACLRTQQLCAYLVARFRSLHYWLHQDFGHACVRTMYRRSLLT